MIVGIEKASSVLEKRSSPASEAMIHSGLLGGGLGALGGGMYNLLGREEDDKTSLLRDVLLGGAIGGGGGVASSKLLYSPRRKQVTDEQIKATADERLADAELEADKLREANRR